MSKNVWPTLIKRRFESWKELPDLDAREEAQMVLSLFGEWSPAWEEVHMPPRELAALLGFDPDGLQRRLLQSGGGWLIRRIQQQGIQTPLILAKGHLEGNHRLAAALYLGMCYVPVYRAVED
jgi:hypothetical protein